MEFVNNLNGIEGRFGIATVQPNRALKKCKIRNLRIEYFQSDDAITLVIPKACSACNLSDECSDEFILQIMEKNSRVSGADAYTSLNF